MADEIIVQYRFTDPDTGYADAIVLPRAEFVAEYGSLTKLDTEKLEAAKAQRVANWQASLEAAPLEPTAEEAKAQAEAEAEAYISTVESLTAQYDALSEKLRDVKADADLVDRLAEVAGVEGSK